MTSSSSKPNLLGLALAGGRSTRMGHDKAQMPHNGQTLLARAVGLLEKLLPRCVASCARGQWRAGYECVEDRHSGIGPAAGVAAGLEKAQELGFDGILALACDLPCMTEPILAALIAERAKRQSGALATLYLEAASGKFEMLAGIYECGFLPLLRAGIEAGEKSLYQMLPADKRHAVPYGPELAPCFLNCNTPADLAALRASSQPEMFPLNPELTWRIVWNAEEWQSG